MQRRAEEIACRPHLDDLSGVHDGHPLAHTRDDAHVVGDQHQGHLEESKSSDIGSRTFACIVVSRAVVGSSATRSAG